MHESGACGMILSSDSLAAVNRLPLGTRSVYGDTTRISLAGRYEPTESDLLFVEQNPDRQLLSITYGHSKDHRPDLKQFKYGLVVSRQGMPMIGNVIEATWTTRCGTTRFWMR